MRTTICMIGLLAALCLSARGGGAWLVVRDGRWDPSEHYRQQIAQLTEQVRQAKLHQIALFIEAESKGNSHLLLGAGVSPKAAPAEAVGRAADVERTTAAETAAEALKPALITVYPVSSPLGAKLPGIGILESQLLGAVALTVEARAAEGDDAKKETTAKPGVYLIAHVIGGGFIGDAGLVSVTVDDEGRLQFEQVLGTRCWISKTAEVAGTIPGVTVTLADQGEPPADNPARRATVEMTWGESTYRFALDLLAEEAKQ